MEELYGDILEVVSDIVTASLEESGIEISEESGKKVADYFNAIYKGIIEGISFEGCECCDCEGARNEECEEGEGEEADVTKDEPTAEQQEASPVSPGAYEFTFDEAAGKFEIFEDSAGKFRFVLKTPEGEMLVISDGYDTAELCQRGVEALRNAAYKAPVEER
ncbi:MAG: DUF1508 domain-containing protein [Eubacteriaceae bacterium]|nr:DUF1508 domain-containing protein [Eubacteriaceae bacterium]